MTAHAGAGLNTANSRALGVLASMGVRDAVLSAELTARQISQIGSDMPTGIVAYGRLPLMLTVNCPISAQAGCKNCTGRVYDRTGRAFPVKCSKKNGYVEILNSDILCISHRLKDFTSADFLMLSLYDETAQTAADIVSLFKSGGRLRSSETVTRGLYYRGVDRPGHSGVGTPRNRKERYDP